MALATLLNIFVSSPSDVADERKITLDVIEQLNRRPHIQEHYILKPLAYEDIVPGAVGEAPQRSVDRYMIEAENADIFICILWGRMGTPVVHEVSGQTFQSGTEYEFLSAYRANQNSRTTNDLGKPHILLYRCMRPISPDAALEQTIKVQQFFKRFEGAGAELKGLYKTYESADEFERILSHDLDIIIAHIFKSGQLDAHAASEQNPVRRDFFRYVPLPANYVTREDLLANVRAGLLTESSNMALISAVPSRPTSLHGMGGIGKTVMARALCDDPAVQAAFPDGILWATLGKDATESDVIGRMREWVTTLGEPVSESIPSLNTLKVRLGSLLEDRACLLIVDDVWHRTLADNFRVGGPHCRLMITTRDSEVAHALGASVQPIPLMTEAEAVELLASWADGALADVDSDIHEKIVIRLDRLPLAVRLAGAQLRRQNPEAWLRRFDVRKLKSSRLEDIHDNLEQTFKLSIEELEANVQRLYAALVIFREDEAIPEAGIVRLWEGLDGLEMDQSSALIDDLASRALLQVTTGNPRTIVLHHLLRDLMGAELEGGVEVAHGALLEAYAEAKRGEGWYTAPDDGYLYTHLTYHLLASGRKEELCTLLTASPEWMEAKFIALSGDMSYVTDLDLATSAFEESQTAAELLQLAQLGAARQVVNQRVSFYTDTDLVTLVLLGRDTEALSYARLRPDPGEKCRGLINIHDARRGRGRAEDRLLFEALDAAKSIENAYGRADTLRSVALALAQAGREYEASCTLLEALDVAKSIQDVVSRADALRAVVLALAQAGHIEQALDVAKSIEDAYRRTDALRAVALALAQAGHIEQALDVAKSIEDVVSRADALRAVALALAQVRRENEASRTLTKALNVAKSIEDTYSRADALRAMALALAQAGRENEASRTLIEALDVAKSIEDAYSRADALRAVVLSLAQASWMEQALEVAKSIEDTYSRADALRTVALALAQARRENKASQTFIEALDVAKSIEDAVSRADALRALVLSLAQASWMEQALDVAKSIEDVVSRADALRAVALALAQAGRENEANQTLTEALEVTKAIEDVVSRADALRAVALALAQAGHIERALEVAKSIENAVSRVDALGAMALSFAQAGREDESSRTLTAALDAIRSIEDAYSRADALRVVALALAQAGREDEASRTFTAALEVTKAIEDAYSRADTLRAVALALAQASWMEQALEVAKSIEDAYSRANALRAVALALARASRMEQALEVTKAIEDAVSRADALRAVALALAQAGREDEASRTFIAALDATRSIEDAYSRADVLRAVALALAQASRMEQALEVTKSIEDAVSRADALRAVALALAQAGREDEASRTFTAALEVTKAIENAVRRADALRAVALALTQAGRTDEASRTFTAALDVTKAIENAVRRADTLRAMALSLAQAGHIEQALDVARSIENAGRRADALRAVAFSLVKAGHFWEAFLVLRPRDLYGYLGAIAEWSPSLEELEPGFSIAVVSEVVRIIGWVRPQWRKTYNIMATSK